MNSFATKPANGQLGPISPIDFWNAFHDCLSRPLTWVDLAWSPGACWTSCITLAAAWTARRLRMHPVLEWRKFDVAMFRHELVPRERVERFEARPDIIFETEAGATCWTHELCKLWSECAPLRVVLGLSRRFGERCGPLDACIADCGATRFAPGTILFIEAPENSLPATAPNWRLWTIEDGRSARLLRPDTGFNPSRTAERNIIRREERRKEKDKTVAEVRVTWPRAYETWSVHEEAELRRMERDGTNVETIARTLGRQPSAIRSRLRKMETRPF